jgi:hypothetical protein
MKLASFVRLPRDEAVASSLLPLPVYSACCGVRAHTARVSAATQPARLEPSD